MPRRGQSTMEYGLLLGAVVLMAGGAGKLLCGGGQILSPYAAAGRTLQLQLGEESSCPVPPGLSTGRLERELQTQLEQRRIKRRSAAAERGE